MGNGTIKKSCPKNKDRLHMMVATPMPSKTEALTGGRMAFGVVFSGSFTH
ncbi:hypothetical protein [Enterococcus sp.]|nr:hypothetical protein [Enterococcus sp.]